MQFAILGPLEVTRGDRPLELGGAKVRGTLAMLLLRAGHPVSAQALAIGLWGEEAPADAVKTVQVHVSRLRKALGDPDRVTTTPAGYVLRVHAGELDAQRFGELYDEGTAALTAGAFAHAARLMREALALWRGPPLADLDDLPFAAEAVSQLEERRLAAIEARIDAELESGADPTELATELKRLTHEHPWHERLRGQLMLALYRGGRQADALAEYRSARETMVAELGVEPGRALKELERRILAQDPDLDPVTAGPPRAVGTTAAEPPRPVTATVGRQDEIRAILARLDREDVSLLTLVGPGGVGKTHLAVEVALAVGRRDRPVLGFVALAAAPTAGHVVPTVARALGVESAPDQDALEVLRGVLRDADGLLVLDNFEHVLAAAPAVAKLVEGCPRITVLTTSREPLAVRAEHLHQVEPLAVIAPSAVPPAVELFAMRARAHDPEFELTDENRGDVEEICSRLDGLPLAIEIAAARSGALTPEQLLSRLAESPGDLGAGPRDLPARQRTLSETIRWSHELLDDEERRAFAALSVFSGGATLEAAQRIADTGWQVLASLINKSLVRRERAAGRPVRLRMLETVRDYASARLDEHAAAAGVRREHRNYYADLAEAGELGLGTPQHREWAIALDAELGNFRAAFASALAEGDHTVALRLAIAMAEPYRRLANVPLAEARGELERALNADSGAAGRLRAKALLRLSRTARYAGDEAAVWSPLLDRALELYRECGDEEGVLRCLCERTFAARWSSQDAARSSAGEVAELAQQLTDPALRALALLAAVSSAPDTERQRPIAEEATRLVREVGDPWQLTFILRNRGYLAMEEGRLDEARRLLDEALASSRQLGSPVEEAVDLGNIAMLSLLEDDEEQAEAAAREGLELSSRHGAVLPVSEMLLVRAALAIRLGDPIEAERLARDAGIKRAGREPSAIEARIEELVRSGIQT